MTLQGCSEIMFTVIVNFQWQVNREKVMDQGSRILEIIIQSMSLKAFSESGKAPPGLECVKSCQEELVQSYDKEYGGFGNAPKFPQPGNLSTVMWETGKTWKCYGKK